MHNDLLPTPDQLGHDSTNGREDEKQQGDNVEDASRLPHRLGSEQIAANYTHSKAGVQEDDV
jgi:hypothetical protein